MKTIIARNVNDAFAIAMNMFRDSEYVREYPSRNGRMIEVEVPVCTRYEKPEERVLFDAARDCNPYLHFFEALWMLAGRNDVGFLRRFTKNMDQFSDDGETLHGAYGHRWRQHFGKDQLAEAVQALTKNPESRRVVTTMWDPTVDAPAWGKDHPCNTQIFWSVRNDELHMTVINRSNDAIWGCFGANAVHFSMLHEYMAGCLGLKLGFYHQVSNSLHIYPDLPVTERVMKGFQTFTEHYKYEARMVFPMFQGDPENWEWDSDLEMFMDIVDGNRKTLEYMWNTPFFKWVVVPFYNSHVCYKEGDISRAQLHASSIKAGDWKKAALEWLDRRSQNK